MSYQAITDILVNPQIQELQLSKTVNDSPKTNSSTGFADILAGLQKETQENGNPKVETPKDEKTSVKEEKETPKTEEKVEDKTEKKTETSKSEETEKSESTEQKDKTKVEEKKVDNQPKKTEKKLTDKDFAKINQITEEKATENISNAAQIANATANNEVKFNLDNKTEKTDEEFTLPENQVELPVNLQVAENSNVENQASEFDFSNKNENKKEFALDKDGKITVQDLRTEVEPEENAKKSDLKITEIKQTSENTATITMDLNQTAEADVLSLNNQTASSNGSNFQAMLNNQIQTSAPEFVKAGNLILKDNNQGTINLVLHPDDLGNVKIHMTLDGKTISGQITVATKEALQVFKDNAETLREAFIKSGFENASFDVALNNGGQFNQNMDFGQQNDGTNLMAKTVYNNGAAGLSSELETIIQNTEDISNYSVNIVA